MKGYEGKAVLVTGASSGIGAGIAESYAKEGASLCITGRNAGNLQKVASTCKDHGSPQVVEIIADLADATSYERVVTEMIKKLRRLDVLVNNAGFYESGFIDTTSMEDYDKQFNVNMKAAYFLTQHATPHLKKVKGSVVNISSSLSSHHVPQFQIYGMTKAALDYFTRCTALELAPSGVRVNAVNPGWVRTGIRARELGKEELDKFYDDMAASTPLGSLISTEEVADAVLFLTSDKASQITGTCLPVDGAITLKYG